MATLYAGLRSGVAGSTLIPLAAAKDIKIAGVSAVSDPGRGI